MGKSHLFPDSWQASSSIHALEHIMGADRGGIGSKMINERIEQFIVDTFLYGEQIGLTNDASLTDSGIVDSTGILELVAFLEKEFCVTVEDNELVPENLDSVDRISQFISRKIGANSL